MAEDSDAKRDPFSVLRDVQERDTGKLKTESIEDKVGRYDGFVYVPSIAFDGLKGRAEYSYLSNGLYVAEKRLLVGDDVRRAASDITELHLHKDGQMLDRANWFLCKHIAKNLGGRIPTAAELFCTMEWLRLFPDGVDHQEFLEDITWNGLEWLDGLLLNHCESYVTHAEVDAKEKSFSGGIMHPLPQLSSGWFDLSTLDKKTYLPLGKKGSEGCYFEWDSYPVGVLYRSLQADFKGNPSLALRIMPPNVNEFFGFGMRMCYTPDEMKKVKRS